MSSAANTKMNNALRSYGAATFGSYARRAERLARFKAAEQKKKAAQMRLKTAIRTEQARVAERANRRAQEIRFPNGIPKEYLYTKVKEAWAAFMANDTAETFDAWWVARSAFDGIDPRTGIPLNNEAVDYTGAYDYEPPAP